MRYEIEAGGRTRQVVVTRVGAGFAVSVDRRTWHVDAARVDGRTLSLIVDGEGPRIGPTPFDSLTLSSSKGELAQGGHGSAPTRTDGVNTVGYGGRSSEVTVVPDAATGQLTVHVGATPVVVTVNGRRRWGGKDDGGGGGTGPQRVTAPMPGKIVRLLVRAGDTVAARQPLVVVEAMKMENELRAARTGVVAEVHAREGASVDAGALLVVIT